MGDLILVQERRLRKRLIQPLKRAIQKHLEDVLSDEMLKGRFKSGGVIEVTLADDELVFTEKSGALNPVP